MGVSEKCYFNMYVYIYIFDRADRENYCHPMDLFFFLSLSLSLPPSRHQSRPPEGSDEKRQMDLGAHYFSDKPIWCQHVLLPKGI